MRMADQDSTTLASDIPALADSPDEPDHVFSLIETAKQKSKAISDCPGEQRDRFDKACADEWLVLDEIVASVPTTLAGVAAVLRYFAARADRDAFREQELIETLLGNMAAALDRIEAVRPS